MGFYSMKREQRIKKGVEIINTVKQLQKELPKSYDEKIQQIIDGIYFIMNN